MSQNVLLVSVKVEKVTILGAGLAGLSCSFHIGHESCILFEANSYAGGRIFSHQDNGFTWDEGPHVSFTKHQYVKDLFEKSVCGDYNEFDVTVGNYFQGNWIPHPAQSNLWALPEPLRTSCLKDFLKVRSNINSNLPQNYGEWLVRAFGQTFAETFPFVYTRKYWTCEPQILGIDWVGDRVYSPDIDVVRKGYFAPLKESGYYIKRVRYPNKGGDFSFASKISDGANIHLNHKVDQIDLRQRTIRFTNGMLHRYDRLVSTLPLPELIFLTKGVPYHVREAANALSCTSALLVNVMASHSELKPYNWLYVYDEDKYSTRINQVGLLSSNNSPQGIAGVQVEVYFSKYKPLCQSHEQIVQKVLNELVEMQLVKGVQSVNTLYLPYANVIFDKERVCALSQIINWLETFGLVREEDDLSPTSDWSKSRVNNGKLLLAGRFSQWKYFWSDDCIMRGLAACRT